jgi:hypothetical protein
MATMDTAGNISTIRGDSIVFELQLLEDDGVTPVDLTGSTLLAQVRTKPNGFVALEFEILQVNPIDGTTLYDLTEGRFLLYASAEVTEGFRKEEYQWDLQMTSSDLVTTIIGPSTFSVTKDITLLTP